MNCLICRNNSVYAVIFTYDKPDRYEQIVGIKDVYREWLQCSACGFYKSERNYDLGSFQKDLYSKHYRSRAFRGKTIKEAFIQIMNMPSEESENAQRFKWFIDHITYKTGASVLDVGSGIGVWPNVLNIAGYDVHCVEPNKDSCKFISNELAIPCWDKIPVEQGIKYDIISCVHVLEHFEDPADFLADVYTVLDDNGELFIEVPDSVEFDCLSQHHNEFSSDHVCFYNLAGLCRLLERCGFKPIHVYRTYYESRNLHRIMMICRKTQPE